MWVTNYNLQSLSPPEIWVENVDIDRGVVKCEEPTDENVVQNIVNVHHEKNEQEVEKPEISNAVE